MATHTINNMTDLISWSVRAHRELFWLSVCWLACGITFGQEAVQLRHRWEFDPDVGKKWVFDHAPPPVTIDTSRLKSTSRQYRIAEAQKVILASNSGGVANRSQTFEALVEILPNSESNHQIKLAMTSAAASLIEEREQCDLIWDAIGEDSSARRAIEPTLVKWQSPAAIEIWRERLKLRSAEYTELLVAIEGIGAVGSQADRSDLEALLRNNTTALPVRIGAAKALGSLLAEGLEETARAVLESNLDQRDLIAAHLLLGHASSDAESLLLEILDGQNDVAQTASYHSIALNFPAKAREMADAMIQHPNSQIRLDALSVLNKIDDATSLNVQASALSDRNVHVRRTARENLEAKARLPNLKRVVDDVITHHLAGDSYEATSQVILLAVALGQNNRASAFVALLDHPRPEVSIRAGWALQELDLQPDTLENIFEHCKITTKRLVDEQDVSFEEIARVAFLFEAFGRHSYKPAGKMLLTYVPKKPLIMRSLTRASAIYALGHIWAGRANKPLTDELVRRINDDSPLDPEAEIVKYTAAVAVERINGGQ